MSKCQHCFCKIAFDRYRTMPCCGNRKLVKRGGSVCCQCGSECRAFVSGQCRYTEPVKADWSALLWR